jgi:multiple sugar transport system permease protein
MRMQGAGPDRALPYLLLAPSVLLVLAVVVYPLYSGIRTSTQFWRFGHAVRDVGLDNYRQAWNDPFFRDALWVTIKFVTCAVALETMLGLGLALLVARELRFMRFIRASLIVPMVVTPVVVGIVFELIYATDAGLLSNAAADAGQNRSEILAHNGTAFLAIVVMDVWEWTPLIFLILLAGIQSLPVEPFEAARVDGASSWQTFWDHTLPMLRPVLAVAIVLRTIDAFTTFDQVYVLTHGGPGTSTQLVSIYGYDVFFKFQQYGYAAAMLLMVGLLVLAIAAVAARLVRRAAL